MLLEAGEGRREQGLADVGIGDWFAASSLEGTTRPSRQAGPCCLKHSYTATMCPPTIPRSVRKALESG